jgi:predicted GNAT superfamily acetyltransferase
MTGVHGHRRDGNGAAADAARQADLWASKAGVQIELVGNEASAREAVSTLGRVWPQSNGAPPLTPELAWALAHSGNYVAVVRSGETSVGAAAAFRAVDETGSYLHSHIVGVLPGCQGRGVGFAVKQHQRAWALAERFERMTWTFDPLVARNAYFNVMKLGAELTRYYVDFYGALTDGINAGDQSDRCLATWWLSGTTAAAAGAGPRPACDAEAARRAGATDVLEIGPGGEPVVRDAAGAHRRLVAIPPDVIELRRRDPALARSWRMALREVLTAAFADSLKVVGVTRESCYVVAAAP